LPELVQVAGSSVHIPIRENESLNFSDGSGRGGYFQLIDLQDGLEGELGEERSLAVILSGVREGPKCGNGARRGSRILSVRRQWMKGGRGKSSRRGAACGLR
jgi:hypothetical protein